MPPRRRRSREDIVHDAAVDVGEAEVAALEFEGEFLVVEAQEVQDAVM